MNSLRKIKNLSLLAGVLFVLAACGVKGDPLPPEKPAEIGRGRPTYKRATEGIEIEKNRRRHPEPKDDEDEDDEEAN